MRKLKEVRIPKRTQDLRIRHFKAFKEYDEFGMDLMDDAKFIAAFLGVKYEQLIEIDKDEFDNLYRKVAKLIAGLNIQKMPPKEIEMNGVAYCLIDPEKTSASWHMDWGEFIKDNGYEKDPVKVACLFYHPKGHFYGELDKHSALVHPVRDKYKIFEEHLPLSTFIEASAFFLSVSLRSMKLSTERKMWELRTLKIVMPIKSRMQKMKRTVKRITHSRGKN